MDQIRQSMQSRAKVEPASRLLDGSDEKLDFNNDICDNEVVDLLDDARENLQQELEAALQVLEIDESNGDESEPGIEVP